MKQHWGKIGKRLSLCLLLIWAPSLVLAAKPIAVGLTAAQTMVIAGNTRLVFELTAPVSYHLFTLVNPDRVVLDLPGVTSHTFHLTPAALRNTLVQEVRTAWHPQQNFLRIVLDLRQPVTPQASLTPTHTYKYQLIVNLFHHSTKQLMEKPVLNLSHKVVQQNPSPSTKAPDLHPLIIVIDPGHGGKDPGATGLGGTHEKNVVLAIARDLQYDLNQIPGFHAVLTRNGDYYIPLRGRLALARKDKPAMFISIHADAYKNHIETGASVFALSERGATSEAARWLAEKENRSELMGGVDLHVGDPTLRSVLMDLTQTHTIDESLQMGASLLQQLSAVTPLRHSQVEQAAFVVLKSPDIPSLLVEVGFLSTPSQERKLQNFYFQQKIARVLMLGIGQYFSQHLS
ncbi:MAG: N-acetylmuramoyl-L-alanine amidase [Gammaproteobacteria bacterium]